MRKTKLFGSILTLLIFAGVMVSCDYNPEGKHCYELRTIVYEWSYNLLIPKQETIQYFWGTKADMKEYQQDIFDQLKAIDPDVIAEIDVELTNKTKSDCH